MVNSTYMVQISLTIGLGMESMIKCPTYPPCGLTLIGSLDTGYKVQGGGGRAGKNREWVIKFCTAKNGWLIENATPVSGGSK